MNNLAFAPRRRRGGGDDIGRGVRVLGGKLSNGLRVRMMRRAVYEQHDD